MTRIAYVSGRYVPVAQAAVAMEDRGYQFADGVYEAMAAMGGVLIDGAWHFERLERSLRELDIARPMSEAALRQVIGELMRRNRRCDTVIYIQVTRGVARRAHVYPDAIKPVLSLSLLPTRLRTAQERAEGVRVITRPDLRWARCDIKTIALLPNVMARMESHRAGAKETWQVRDGVVTEGTLANAYLVDAAGVVHTHPADTHILGGVRRRRTLQLARELGIPVREHGFTLADIAQAREAFQSSCSAFITPVVAVDDQPVGDGAPGPVTGRLMEAFDEAVRRQTGKRPA